MLSGFPHIPRKWLWRKTSAWTVNTYQAAFYRRIVSRQKGWNGYLSAVMEFDLHCNVPQIVCGAIVEIPPVDYTSFIINCYNTRASKQRSKGYGFSNKTCTLLQCAIYQNLWRTVLQLWFLIYVGYRFAKPWDHRSVVYRYVMSCSNCSWSPHFGLCIYRTTECQKLEWMSCEWSIQPDHANVENYARLVERFSCITPCILINYLATNSRTRSHYLLESVCVPSWNVIREIRYHNLADAHVIELRDPTHLVGIRLRDVLLDVFPNIFSKSEDDFTFEILSEDTAKAMDILWSSVMQIEFYFTRVSITASSFDLSKFCNTGCHLQVDRQTRYSMLARRLSRYFHPLVSLYRDLNPKAKVYDR